MPPQCVTDRRSLMPHKLPQFREHPIDRDGLWPVAYGLGMIRGPTDYTTTFKPHDFSLSPTSPHSYSIHYCHVDRLDFIPRNMTYFKRDKKEKMPCDN